MLCKHTHFRLAFVSAGIKVARQLADVYTHHTIAALHAAAEKIQSLLVGETASQSMALRTK
jgi:hypothetical protein